MLPPSLRKRRCGCKAPTRCIASAAIATITEDTNAATKTRRSKIIAPTRMTPAISSHDRLFIMRFFINIKYYCKSTPACPRANAANFMSSTTMWSSGQARR